MLSPQPLEDFAYPFVPSLPSEEGFSQLVQFFGAFVIEKGGEVTPLIHTHVHTHSLRYLNVLTYKMGPSKLSRSLG